jgi:hypothetical protein
MPPLIRVVRRCLALVAAAVVFSAHGEVTLYAATMHAHPGTNAEDMAGSLYVVDPSTGAAKPVGTLRLDGKPIGIAGLAVHPGTGVLYGATAASSPNYRNSLVTIDPATAQAGLVGAMDVAGSGIGFSPDGDLYMWLPDTNQVGRIDLASGRVRPLGGIGESTRTERGLAFDGRGRLYVTPADARGQVEIRDPASGAATPGPVLSNVPYASSLNSFVFSPAGRLYGVSSDMGMLARAALVKVDLAKGLVTPIGPLPEDTDCLAFVDATRASFTGTASPASIVIVGSFIAVSALGYAMWFRGRRRRALLRS